MAKKKTTTTTVEEEITPVEEHDQNVLDALSTTEETPELEIKTEELDDPETETPTETPAVEPTIDKEALKEELKTELSEEVKKEVEALKTDQTPDQKDEYDKFVDDYTTKNGQAPEWKQVATFLKEQAKTELKAELDAEVEQEKQQELEATKAQESRQQETNDTLNKQWDRQIDDLVKTGKIVGIKDPNDVRVQDIKDANGKVIEQIPLEPGKRARYELFKTMYLASEEEIQAGGEPITNLKEVFYEHYNKDKQPAGADAPIAGIRKSVSQDNGRLDYNEVHNKSFEDLLIEAQ